MGFFDILFEQEGAEKNKRKTKRRFRDLLFEETKSELEFADSESVENMSNTVKGKIQARKRELAMLSMALTTIKTDDFPGSKEVIGEYLELVEMQENLAIEEAQITGDDFMATVALERNYNEFDKIYKQRIPRIKSLFLLREIKVNNANMERTFNTRPAREITEKDINEYIEYVRKISDQKFLFDGQYEEQLLEELIVAEYRLKMLLLMRNIYMGTEEVRNPFSRDSAAKKAKFGEMILNDINKSDQQYQLIVARENVYIRTKTLEPRVFEELDRQANELNVQINNGLIDDFSIEGVFENSEYDVLKMFVRFKSKMNEIDSIYEEAQKRDDKQQSKKKKSKSKHDDEER